LVARALQDVEMDKSHVYNQRRIGTVERSDWLAMAVGDASRCTQVEYMPLQIGRR